MTNKPTSLKSPSSIAKSPKPRCLNPTSTPPATASAQALEANKNVRAPTSFSSDIPNTRQGNFPTAVEAYSAIEQQTHAYLSMVGEKLYEAYAAQANGKKASSRLIGYMQTFPRS